MQEWKLREKKQRHQTAGVENVRNGNNGTMLQGWKMRHKPLWTAKRTLSTTLVNFSVVVGSLHVDGLRIKTKSGRRSPYCEDMWRRYCCLTSIFRLSIHTCLNCEDIARQSCTMVPRWRFFASCIFSEPRAAGHYRHAF